MDDRKKLHINIDTLVAPGQERHLPHDMGHVVSQQQGRVNPCDIESLHGISDDGSALGWEVDMMGARAFDGMKKQLTDFERHVLLDKGTEPPFTGEYYDFTGEDFAYPCFMY